MSNLPKRYTEGLTPSQIKDLERNIERTKKLINKGKEDEAIKLAEKRPQPAELKEKRKSSFTTKLEKIYNINKLPDTPSKEFQKLTGLSVADQEEIIQRGKKAFLTAGSRRGTNAFAWATARLYAFVVKTVEANKKNLDKINQDQDIFIKVRSKIKM